MSKILHITQRYWPALGGAELFVKTLAQHNLKQGHDVEVWTTDADEPDALWNPNRRKFEIKSNEIIDGVRVRRFKISNFFTNNFFINKGIRYILTHLPIWKLQILGFPPYVPDMLKELRSNSLPRYDIIHVSCMPYVSLHYFAMELGKKTGAKLYMTPFQHVGVKGIYSSEDKYYHPRVYPFFAKADKVFVQTKAEYDEINSYMSKFNGIKSYNELLNQSNMKYSELVSSNTPFFLKIFSYLFLGKMGGVQRIFNIVQKPFRKIDIKEGFSENKLELVGLGIYPEEVSGGNGDNFRKEWNISNDEQIIFYVGAKTYVKGIFNLVHAFKKVLDGDKNVRLVLAGPTTKEFEDFYQTVDSYVKDKVILIDSILDAKKRDLFAAGDIFCMNSKSDSFGIVYLEAWMNRKPVISSDLEAMKYVVDEGVDGYRVAFDDIKTLSQKLMLLLNDKKLRDTLGDNGYNKVMSKYTWDIKFKILDKYFNE